jgi:hypothetical protein
MAEKPKLEDIIPEYLDGDMRRTALDFVEYMRTNKMSPSYRPSLRYKCNYKGKGICTIRLPRGHTDNEFDQPWMPDGNRTKNYWAVVPELNHFNDYESIMVDEGFKDIILDRKNIYFCNGCHGRINEECNPNPNRTILDREFKGLCGRAFFWFFNPGEAEIDCIKRLLELEQKARTASII